MQRKNGGFTLMELMIVVTVIGILAALVFPSYSSYVLRTNRTVAKTVLTRIASQQESFFTDRKTYATALNGSATNGLSNEYGAATVYLKRDGTTVTANTADAIYQITLPVATATTFTVSAAPINAQAKDTKCGTITYDNTGAKTASGTSPSDCWTR